MCDGLGEPSTVTEALGMLDRALDRLNAADAASLPASVQGDVLRGLERAGAKHTAARSRVLAAFAGQAAYEDDGQGSPRAWLKWQTQVTNGAAAGAVGWVRRLDAHPVIAAALAAGDLSESWARQVCAWTDRLPVGTHDDADEILAAAARSGVDLAGLGGLAREMYERAHRDRDSNDAPDGFGERAVWLGTTLGGAGRLTGDLTPGVRRLCRQCWRRWASGPVPKTSAARRSAVTTRWRRRAEHWPPRECCRAGPASRPRSRCI
jgi:hypothetical protein